MGAPTISGGMTYQEQKKLLEEQALADEAAWQKQQDTLKKDRADQEAIDEAKREAIKAEELARVAQVQMAEEESIKESQAMKEEKAPSKVKVDFYKSLYSGMGSNTSQTQMRPR